MDFVFVYTVCASPEEADIISKAVVGQRLAACANILPGHRSVYWWDGDVQEGQELAVIFKTRADLFEKLEAAIKALHSYDVPCIVALPIEKAHAPFLKWIGDETAL